MLSNDDASLPSSFRRLAWSNLAAQSGEQIALAAAPIIAVLALGAGVGETGLLQTALTLPFLLFAIPAGLMTDRLQRRRLMASAEALRAASPARPSRSHSDQHADLAAARAPRFRRRVRDSGVQRGGAGTGSRAGCCSVAPHCQRSHRACAHDRICRRACARRTARRMDRCGDRIRGRCGSLGGGCCAALSASRSRSGKHLRDATLFRRSRRGRAFVFHHAMLRPVFVTQFVFNTAFFVILAIFVPHAVHNLGLAASGVGVTLGMFGVGMVRWRPARAMDHAPAQVRRRRRHWAVRGAARGRPDGVDDLGADAAACGPRLLPARCRADPVGHQHDDTSANRDAAGPARPGLRDQHHGLWSAPDRLRPRGADRRTIRGRMPACWRRSPGFSCRPSLSPGRRSLASSASPRRHENERSLPRHD